jgi:citrate synthase
MGQEFKTKFIEKATPLSGEIRSFVKQHADFALGVFTVEDVYAGMKGVIGLLTETSLLDANEGIRFRGHTIPELRAKLPKVPGGTEPLPEGLFYLMVLGEIPTY